jgi:hypothetical protein
MKFPTKNIISIIIMLSLNKKNNNKNLKEIKSKSDVHWEVNSRKAQLFF